MAYTPETVFVDKLPQICVNLELISVYDVACKSIPELLYLLSQKINATLTTVEHNDKALEAAVNELKVKLDAYIEAGLTDEVIDILDKLDKDGWFDAIIDERLDEKLGNLSESNVIAEIIKARDGFTTLGARIAKAGYVFDTIADLQAIIRDTPLVDGTVVEVLGYYTAGDGAGHKRIISATDDGSGVAVGNKWANLCEKGFVNVKHFGASPSLNDNSTNIQKALNYTSKIDFSGEVFRSSSVLLSNSLDSLELKSGTIEVVGETFLTTSSTSLEQIRQVKISNMNFECSNGKAISFYNETITSNQDFGLIVENSVFKGGYNNDVRKGVGVYLEKNSNVHFNNVKFQSLETAFDFTDINNFFFTGGTVSNCDNVSTKFSMNVAQNCGYHFMNVNIINNSSINLKGVDQLEISNCMFDFNKNIDFTGSTNLNVSNCYFGQNATEYLTISSIFHSQMNNCHFINYTNEGCPFKFHAFTKISNCHFSQGDYFIDFSDAISESLITACTFDTNKKTGYFFKNENTPYLRVHFANMNLRNTKTSLEKDLFSKTISQNNVSFVGCGEKEIYSGVFGPANGQIGISILKAGRVKSIIPINQNFNWATTNFRYAITEGTGGFGLLMVKKEAADITDVSETYEFEVEYDLLSPFLIL